MTNIASGGSSSDISVDFNRNSCAINPAQPGVQEDKEKYGKFDSYLSGRTRDSWERQEGGLTCFTKYLIYLRWRTLFHNFTAPNAYTAGAELTLNPATGNSLLDSHISGKDPVT